MKYKKTMTSFVILLLCFGGLYAQKGLPTAGGMATGAEGSVSYTVGQLAYTTQTSDEGSVAQGVQQAFEIFTTVGIHETSIQLDLSVYPNPTANYLTLKTDGSANMSYQLSDMNGKILENKEINGNNTSITLENQPVATYFLSVLKNNQLLKTFKIIKN